MKIRIHNPIYGVPITFLDKYNPEQFELIGRTGDLEWCENECKFFSPPNEFLAEKYKKQDKTWRIQNGYLLMNKKPKTVYGRLFIRRKS